MQKDADILLAFVLVGYSSVPCGTRDNVVVLLSSHRLSSRSTTVTARVSYGFLPHDETQRSSGSLLGTLEEHWPRCACADHLVFLALVFLLFRGGFPSALAVFACP